VAWVEVRDTGSGMPAELRARAFEPYASGTRARGAGVGLAEVYAVMRRHRGRAELRTTPEAGTAVRLVFPHAPAR
jgi:signal transduction histidine kinase